MGELGLGGCHPLKIQLRTSDFDEIWVIYVNFPEKNNRSGENSIDGPLRGIEGVAAQIKIFAWLLCDKSKMLALIQSKISGGSSSGPGDEVISFW